MTYPLVGNYGVPDGPFESDKIQVQGLVVQHHCANPSHFELKRTLGEWLQHHGIPAIEDVDTRCLTRHLRTHGTIPGKLIYQDHEKSAKGFQASLEAVEMKNVAQLVSAKEVIVHPGGEIKILLIDSGVKNNIIRSLQAEGATVIQIPFHSAWEKYLGVIDGLLLANGPGDPEDVFAVVKDKVQAFLQDDLPIFGICMGHQILSLAAGAKTYKLKFGHRSHNQPVLDVIHQRAYLTSQNHSYAVDHSLLSKDWEPWFVNLNDGSNEGIRHKSKPIRSVQFHPEASAGPRDTSFLFGEFLKTVQEYRSLRLINPNQTRKISGW